MALNMTVPMITGVVALHGGFEGEQPDARPGGILGDQRATQEVRDCQAEEGDERQERVAERVPEDDDPLLQPLRLGGADVILADHLEASARECSASTRRFR